MLLLGLSLSLWGRPLRRSCMRKRCSQTLRNHFFLLFYSFTEEPDWKGIKGRLAGQRVLDYSLLCSLSVIWISIREFHQLCPLPLQSEDRHNADEDTVNAKTAYLRGTHGRSERKNFNYKCLTLGLQAENWKDWTNHSYAEIFRPEKLISDH